MNDWAAEIGIEVDLTNVGISFLDLRKELNDILEVCGAVNGVRFLSNVGSY